MFRTCITSLCIEHLIKHWREQADGPRNVMVGKEFIQISPGRLKFFTYTGHITCLLLSIITGMSTSVLKFAAMHSFDTALRFVIVFIFLDPSVSIPFQLLYTTVDMLIYVFVLEGRIL